MSAKRKANALHPLSQLPLRRAKQARREASPKVVVQVASVPIIQGPSKLELMDPPVRKVTSPKVVIPQPAKPSKAPPVSSPATKGLLNAPQHPTLTSNKLGKPASKKKVDTKPLVYPQTEEHPYQTMFTKFLRLHGPDAVLQAEKMEQEIGEKLAKREGREERRKIRKEERLATRKTQFNVKVPAAKVGEKQKKHTKVYRSPYENMRWAEDVVNEVRRRYLAGELEEGQQEQVDELYDPSSSAVEIEEDTKSLTVEERLRNARIVEWNERVFEESGVEAAFARDVRTAARGHKKT